MEPEPAAARVLGEVGAGTRLGALSTTLALLRVQQWPKNLLVFASLIFGRKLAAPGALAACGWSFLAFCLVSSAVYVANDVADAPADRQHPLKRSRPIASGAVRPAAALPLAAALFAASAGIAWIFVPSILWILGAYAAVNVAYSLGLKRLVMIDLLVIGAGFILRAHTGSVVLEIPSSDWMLLCAGALALFVASCKRRMEVEGPPESRHATRAVMRYYSPELLEQLTSIAAVLCIVFYGLYCSELNQSRPGGSRMMWTLPPVVYGILHYLAAVRRNLGSGRSLLVDPALVVTVGVWIALVLVALK